MDMKKEWIKMAEKTGKQAELYFYMAENAQNDKKEEYLEKQLKELEKQYECIKNVSRKLI